MCDEYVPTDWVVGSFAWGTPQRIKKWTEVHERWLKILETKFGIKEQ